MREIFKGVGSITPNNGYCRELPAAFSGLQKSNQNHVSTDELISASIKNNNELDIKAFYKTQGELQLTEKRVDFIEYGGENSFHGDYVFKGTRIKGGELNIPITVGCMDGINKLFIQKYKKVMEDENLNRLPYLNRVCLAIQKALHCYEGIYLDNNLYKGIERASMESVFAHNLLKSVDMEDYLISSKRCMISQKSPVYCNMFNLIKIGEEYFIFDPANPSYEIKKYSYEPQAKISGSSNPIFNNEPPEYITEISLRKPSIYQVTKDDFDRLKEDGLVRVTHKNILIENRHIGYDKSQRVYGGAKRGQN